MTLQLWDVPDNGDLNGAGYVVMAETASEARQLALDYCRRQFDEWFAGPERQQILARARAGEWGGSRWQPETWDREMWRRWYSFGVSKEWTAEDDPDDEIGEPVLIDGPVYPVPVLGYT